RTATAAIQRSRMRLDRASTRLAPIMRLAVTGVGDAPGLRGNGLAATPSGTVIPDGVSGGDASGITGESRLWPISRSAASVAARSLRGRTVGSSGAVGT